MRKMMLCGVGNFKDVDREEGAGGAKVKPAKSGSKGKGNPYASRGLDKFSTVLSELESRRERILRRAGPGVDADHLMVRFVKSEAKGWVPIVVKLPQQEEEEVRAADAKKRPSKPTSRPPTPPTEPASPKEDPAKAKLAHAAAAAKAAVPARTRWVWAWGRKVRPRHYLPLAAALLLLSLVVFGRMFAICCTSIWWYLLPILIGESATRSTTAPKARKDVGSKASDKLAAVAPPSHGKKSSSGAAHEVMSPRSHALLKKG